MTPYVISVVPGDGSVNVKATPKITVTFSERIAPESVSDSSVVLYRGSTRIAASVTLSDSTVTLVPDSVLKTNYMHSIHVTSLLRDLSGNQVRDTGLGGFVTEPVATTLPDTWAVKLTKGNRSADQGLFPNAMVLTRDSGIVVVGQKSGWPSLAKVLQNGTIEWRHEMNLNYTNWDNGAFRGVIQRDNGFLVMVGDRTNFDGTSDAHCLTMVVEDGLPGTGFDHTLTDFRIHIPLAIESSPSDGYIIAGTKDTPKGRRIRLVETDYFGQIQWERSLGDDIQGTQYDAQELISTPDGGYLIGATKWEPDATIYLIKTDDTGATVWEQSYGQGQVMDVCTTGDQGYYVCANQLIKLSADGTVVWSRTDFDGGAYGVTVLSDDGCVIAGSAASSGMLLAKYDAGGTLQWRREISGGGLVDVLETDDGSLIVIGSVTGSGGVILKFTSEGEL